MSSGEAAAVGRRELRRHPVYTRWLHWGVALFFVLSLLSGFAIYTPWLYQLLTPLFGGGPTTRLLHPWFSVAFVVVFTLQMLNWWRPMAWTADDTRWLRRLRRYVSHADTTEPAYVDFFNGGQKLYFWAIAASAVVFVVSGVPMWWPAVFGRTAVAIGYLVHDLAAVVMLAGFIVHIYEATAAQPGTFRSMMRGTVDERWAATHHPKWHQRTTGPSAANDPPRARGRASGATAG